MQDNKAKVKKVDTKASTPKMTLKEKLDAIKYKAPAPKVAAKPEKSSKKKSLRNPSGLQTLKTLQPLK